MCRFVKTFAALAFLLAIGAARASATPTQHYITLSWTAATESNPPTGVTCCTYNIYRATVSGGPYSEIKTGETNTTYNDPSGTSGVTYYYVITASDSAGNEGPYSNEASATFLASPTAPMGVTATAH